MGDAQKRLVKFALVPLLAALGGCSSGPDDSRRTLGVTDYAVAESTLMLSTESCNAEPTVADLVQTSTEVRVRVVSDRPASSLLCSDILKIPLDSPLGERAVIDASTGTEVERGEGYDKG